MLSVIEDKYLAAAETYHELQWIKSLLEELGVNDCISGANCTKLHIDNQSAIFLIGNHDNHKISKHIALRNYYCREQYEKGHKELMFIPSSRQLANNLTKVNSSAPLQ